MDLTKFDRRPITKEMKILGSKVLGHHLSHVATINLDAAHYSIYEKYLAIGKPFYSGKFHFVSNTIDRPTALISYPHTFFQSKIYLYNNKSEYFRHSYTI